MYTIEWMIPGRVVLTTMWGEISIEDVHAISNGLKKFYEEGTPMIHSVVDVSRIEKYPNLLELQRSGKVEMHNEERVGWTVIVGTNRLIKFIVSMFMQFLKLRFKMLDSQAEALAYLQEGDKTLIGVQGDTNSLI
jgi:hypothetical protein